MAWAEQWTHKVDGVNLNDFTNFITYVPELENEFDDDVILVPVDGRPPAYIRNQPGPGTYTFLIHVVTAGSWATWNSRMNTLRALMTKGAHLYEVQARGMTAAKSTTIIVKNSIVAVTERSVVYPTTVPVPIVF